MATDAHGLSRYKGINHGDGPLGVGGLASGNHSRLKKMSPLLPKQRAFYSGEKGGRFFQLALLSVTCLQGK